jgi:hypothetical protein
MQLPAHQRDSFLGEWERGAGVEAVFLHSTTSARGPSTSAREPCCWPLMACKRNSCLGQLHATSLKPLYKALSRSCVV